MTRLQVTRVLSPVVLLVSLAACGDDPPPNQPTPTPPTPPAPTITYSVRLSANPSTVSSPTGTSSIEVSVVRADDNQAPPTGTAVTLQTSLGTIESNVSLSTNGTATATLRGDGRIGTATVTASILSSRGSINVRFGQEF